MENNNHISQEEFEKFERFILGHMADQERMAFEKEVASDKILSQKLEDMKVILEGVEEAAFRINLDQIHQELELDTSKPTESKKPNFIKENIQLFPWKPISIAASLLLTIGFFAWLLLFRSDPNERLFLTYYQPDPGLVTAMSSNSNYEFDRGMVDYKTGNYQDAIERWENLLAEKPENDTLNYFIGSAFLAMDDPAHAKSFLEKASHMTSSIFAKEASWYLGLSFLKSRNHEEAIKYLQYSEREEAAEIIAKLK